MVDDILWVAETLNLWDALNTLPRISSVCFEYQSGRNIINIAYNVRYSYATNYMCIICGSVPLYK